MSVTSLKINDHRVQFITQQLDDLLYIITYECDDNFIPKGKGIESNSMMTEEEYHKSLRRYADEKGHYVPQLSTNPEWNPPLFNELVDLQNKLGLVDLEEPKTTEPNE